MSVINIPAFTGAYGVPTRIPVVTGRSFDRHLLKISKVLSEPLMAEGDRDMERIDSALRHDDTRSGCRLQLHFVAIEYQTKVNGG